MKNRISVVMLGLLLWAPWAGASDIILNPNTFQGTIRFDNSNPTIQALLVDEGFDLASIIAQSSDGQFTCASGYITPTSATSAEYSISCESTGSPTYRIQPTAFVNRRTANATGNGQHHFAAQTVVLPEANPNGPPNPVTVDFVETPGVVQLNFSSPIQGGDVFIQSGFSLFRSGVSTTYLFLAGGTPQLLPIRFTTGTDPAVDTISFLKYVTVNPAPDTIQAVNVPVPNTPDQLGQIQTPYDVPGHELIGALLTAATAEFVPIVDDILGFTFRPIEITSTPATRPVSQPSLWPLFANLVPGPYGLQAHGNLDHGAAQAYFRTAPTVSTSTPAGSVTVQGNQSTDGAKTIDGTLRYPLVMTPGHFQGTVRLFDQYVANNPGAPSTLETLLLPLDYPSTTCVAPVCDPLRGPSGGTTLRADNGKPDGSFVHVTFPDHFDTATGLLESSYLQPILNVYDVAIPWFARNLQLYFSTEAHHWAGDWQAALLFQNPALIDPAQYRNGYVKINVDPSGHTIGPNDTAEVDYHLCFNEVRMQYQSLSGVFVNPAACFDGALNGTDFEGNTANQTMDGCFYGTPAIGSTGGLHPWLTPAKFIEAARSTGEVALVLPQGTWDIRPTATFVSPQGQPSTGNFVGFNDFQTGCGDRISLSPGLGVSLDPFPSCAPANPFHISGTVESADEEVSGITVTVSNAQGTTTLEICTGNCPPEFSADVTLGAGVNTITVTATSPFVTNPASTSRQIQLCNEPPDCSLALASPAVLWPPNHKFVPVAIERVTDTNGDPTTIIVTQVTQDEPVDDQGDGNTAPDAKLQGASNPVLIRGERSGKGNGRVYQIGFTAEDGVGGICSGAVSVCVPHDQGNGSSCVDDGQNYDSLIAP